ncbi:hypothetical protein D7147_16275 [Micromonospora musae]|uniref:Uncharacterized protein n=1 Tax=Micromonospora musae TaxID=1894970 RepID=A0ABX9R6N5_9ACTN|nr:hypothetical protein [Micromonospora musae]RKN18956.1 hypothetical protein D7147_16275 [Micromonospora musae]
MTRGLISSGELRLEVAKLTSLMRDDSDFSDLRDVLTSKDLPPGDTLLAGLVSGEDDSQYGVLVVGAGECVLFEIDSHGSLIRWEVVDDISALEDDFDAIAVGVEMKSNGELP